MINKFVNERTIMIITSIGIFYYLYMKYTELTERQEYLERNIVRVVEHLNKLTIDQVVQEVNEDINSTTVEVGDDNSDNQNRVYIESDEEYSYIQSDEHVDTEEENYDDPQEVPEDETIIIGNKNTEQLKGSHCCVVLHSGKRKGFVCGKPATDGYCGVHKKRVPKPMEDEEDTDVDEMDDVRDVIDL